MYNFVISLLQIKMSPSRQYSNECDEKEIIGQKESLELFDCFMEKCNKYD
jgi:hypothetical protein